MCVFSGYVCAHLFTCTIEYKVHTDSKDKGLSGSQMIFFHSVVQQYSLNTYYIPGPVPGSGGKDRDGQNRCGLGLPHTELTGLLGVG